MQIFKIIFFLFIYVIYEFIGYKITVLTRHWSRNFFYFLPRGVKIFHNIKYN